jgi:hypothetical protein
MSSFARWSKTRPVSLFDKKWDSMPATPGVYIIKTSRPIHRIGGVDRTGILYVGRTSRIRSRLWQFLNCNHPASGFLWVHVDFARLILDSRIRTVTDCENWIYKKLRVRYATPIYKSRIARAERALLFAYMSRFGESPPLNLSINERWDAKPSPADLRWAEAGIGPD